MRIDGTQLQIATLDELPVYRHEHKKMDRGPIEQKIEFLQHNGPSKNKKEKEIYNT